MKLTAGQRGLIKLLEFDSANSILPVHVRRRSLQREFAAARRAGLIQPAGYETTVAADDWLESPAGRQALADAANGER